MALIKLANVACHEAVKIKKTALIARGGFFDQAFGCNF